MYHYSVYAVCIEINDHIRGVLNIYNRVTDVAYLAETSSLAQNSLAF